MNLAIHKPRRTNWTAALGLAALMLPALAPTAHAAPPSPNPAATPVFLPNASNSQANTGANNAGPIPFSWLQYKQSLGLPGAPTVPQYPSYDPTNLNAYGTVTGNPYYGTGDAGNEYSGDYIRAYLLGDYDTNEPPGGFNNFFDEILSGTSGVAGFTAPDVNYGASSVTPIICDDDNTLNISSVTGGTPVATTTTVTGFAHADAGWAALSPNVAGQIPSNINNYNGDSYDKTAAISRRKHPTSTNNPGPGAPYTFFHWYPAVDTPGVYTAYAWFPSQNATVGTGQVLPTERHVIDAEYQILINGTVVQTAKVDQQSGGTWVQIGGPFNFPAQAQADFTTGGAPIQPTGVTNATVEIRLDNTTADAAAIARGANGDPDATTFIVADAVELRGEDGSTTRMVSSPVAVNKTDYPELFSGYSAYVGDTSASATVPYYGGLFPEYEQSHLVTSAIAGSTGTVDATNTDVYTGIFPVGGPGTVRGVAPTAGGSTLPIDQLVYFTRTETIASSTDPTAVQTVGAVYCVDGRNGNVVWRYPSINPVVVPDTDITVVPPATTPHFVVTAPGTTTNSSPTGYNGELYYYAPAVASGGTNFAMWTLPPPATGVPATATYQIEVYLPTSTTQSFATNAFYTIVTANGPVHCVVDQSQGPGFVPLVDTNGNSTFRMLPGTGTVMVSDEPTNMSGSGPVIAADAVEFVPTNSLGTTDSTPAIVRNMRVLTVPNTGGTTVDKWETRTCVIVADNSGKVYALDAAGNQDGNDTLYDANGHPVSFDATGATTNPPAGGYVLPYTPKQYGTTKVYWIWQPNPSSQIAAQVIDDNTNTTPTAGQSLFTVDTTNAASGFSAAPVALPDAYPPPTGTANFDTVVDAATAPNPPDFVTWSPLLPAGTSLCNVYVWFPTNPLATTSAQYTVVDAAGTKHVVLVDQSNPLNSGQWLSIGQYTFSPTASNPPAVVPPGQYATVPNTIVLDNTTDAAAHPTDVGKTVYADAVRVDVIIPSQLITPLAFQMCSPTVSLAPTNTAIYTTGQQTVAPLPAPPANGPPTNDATIYIGNSNGVMYSLEGGGVFGPPPTTDIRRNISLDPATPTAGVNWWFNFGGTLHDTDGENTLGTTYAPAYDPYDGPTDDINNPLVPDGLLYFTTFSPQALDDGGSTNAGYLFAVDAKYGPFGDGGDTGGAYTAGDPTSRVGTQRYNNNPLPYWTFPDKFGTLVNDPSIFHSGVASPAGTAPTPLFYPYEYTYGATPGLVIDHLLTSGLPAVTETALGRTFPTVPAAAPVGDAAGSPTVYTASVTGTTVPAFNAGRRVYFAANDPNTESPSAGRIYGIDPMTGKLDTATANSYPFIYPATLGTATGTPGGIVSAANPSGFLSPPNPYGDPNLVAASGSGSSGGDPNEQNAIYVGGTPYNYNTTDVPNAFGAFTDQDASTGYFVSSSPVAAPITYLTNEANLPGAVTNLPTGAAGATGAGIDVAASIPAGTGQTVQMMYMADLTGLMHYIDLTGNPGATTVPTSSTPAVDLYKDVFDYQVGDGIISTPALVPNASGAGYTTPEPVPSTTNPPTGNDVGGALFVTTEGGDIVELEAFPSIDAATSTTAVRLKDWTYAGPGGYSSPAVASFNTSNVLVPPTTDLGDSEWIYVGGDQGTCYGFTPNNTSASGTLGGGAPPQAGAPGTYTNPTNLLPPATVPPNRNFYTIVTANQPPATVATGTNPSISYDSTQGPPLNPVFDWGQTAYIEIFGVDQPNPANASSTTPKAIRITFTIRPLGRVGRGLRTVNKVIDLQSMKNVYPITTPGGGATAWPPTNATLSVLASGAVNPAAATATGTIVGPNVAVYAYQLGDGTGDPQTPGPKVQISNVTEQVQYYDASTPPKLVTATLQGTADPGSIIRTKTAAGAAGLGATAAVDQGTFSTLNPLAVRGAARSIGDTSPAIPQVPGVYNYYNMTLSPQGRPTLGQLGPFSGVDNNPPGTGAAGSTALAVSKNNIIFGNAQAAMNNGNSLLTYAPLGGTEYTYKDTTHADAQFVSASTSTLVQTQSPPQYQVIVVASAGLVSHGTNTVGATPASANLDPVASSAAPNNATPPTTASGNDYGQALLNILDRSALGAINTPITRLRMNNPKLDWNDNSETGGGSGAVINPLPWEQMPQAYYVAGRGTTPDYPDIGSANTSVELVPRQDIAGHYSTSVDSPAASPATALGSETYITAADATLAPSDNGIGAARQLFPNAAKLHVAIPRYQPANLESYPQMEGTTPVLGTGTGGGILYPGVNHADMTNQLPANVAEGYVARGQVFIDTRGNGRRDRTEAYRSVQVWTGVPADTSTSVAETTVDIGSVPAGFGLYGTGPLGTGTPDNGNWSPLIPGTTAASPYAYFFKPITIIDGGNVNLMNVHLDQRIAGNVLPYLPFLSDTINDPYGPYGLTYPQSLVPSNDYNTAGATLTGTTDLPLVRSNFDFFDPDVTWTGSGWVESGASMNPEPEPKFDTLLPNSLLLNGMALTVPGATLHKPRPGDPAGTVMTIPDTPHNNYPNINGSVNLAAKPYDGRPVVSMALPLGTPVGTYSSTIRAFEGYDPNSQTYQGPIYAGNPVTALGPWTPSTTITPTPMPASKLTYSNNAAVQTVSDPGTTLRATVVETRLTDGVPLPVSSTTFSATGVPTNTATSAVLPMIDSGPPMTTGATPTAIYNSNDIQPWAYYDPAANTGGATGASPVVGLLWASQRAAGATAPYGIYGTGLTSLTTPTNMTGVTPSWWAAPVSLVQQGSNPSVVAAVAATANPAQAALGSTALWVTSGPTGNQLQGSGLVYANGTPSLVSPVTLLTRTQPIFGPRGTYVYAGPAGTLALSSLTVVPANLTSTTPTDPAPGNTPLVFWSTRVGGRSQILYWPAVKADPNAAGKVIVTSGVLTVPADLRSAANPTAVARIVDVAVNGALTPVGVVDVTYTGVSAATGQSDVYTSRYLVNINGDTPPTAADTTGVKTLSLVLTPSLPVVTLAAGALPVAPTAYLPTVPTVTEPLVNDGQNGLQTRSTGWLRDTNAYELDALLEQTTAQTTGGNPIVTAGTTLPLIPSYFFSNLPANHVSQAVYDKSSGQWIFTVKWSELSTFYATANGPGAGRQADLLNFANWLYNTPTATSLPTSNLIVYTNPAAGTVNFSVPVPKTTTITSTTAGGTITSTLSAGFQAQVNPQAQRVTFRNHANVASISFIDNTMKTNAGPYGATTGGGTISPSVSTGRSWNIYRKVQFGNGNAAATSSVLYYKTRRLTVVLPVPIQLTQNAATGVYTVTNLKVTLGGVDVTSDVDVDWSRGRLYFPAIQPATNGPGYDGQTVAVTYTDSLGTVHGPVSYLVSWQDEQQANDPGAASDLGEHVIPISNAVNESDPSAFLNPAAGDTQTTATNQSSAHSVWLFWSSSRNASATNGSGADLYWETIDPRFEVVPGP